MHHEFRPDINGLRALAVLSVVAFHAGLPAPGGFVGVDIFFVISGFLISRIILSEREAGDFSLLDFYGKRVKRILPALLLVLFATWVAGWFLFNPIQYRQLGGHLEGSSYFSLNLWLYRQATGPGAYFDWKSRLIPLLHLWSLSIEEQFYLIWPAVILILFKARRLLTPAIIMIFLASLTFGVIQTNANSSAIFYLLSARAWELALGALLAEREVFWKPGRPGPIVANLGAAAGIFLMLFSIFWLINENSPWPGYLALAPTLGCALVIVSPGAGISEILLGNRVAQFFGAISYPLYLWHWPLLAFAHNQIGKDLPREVVAPLLVAAVLLAWLTWRFVERPIAKAYLSRPVVVAAPLLASLALAGGLGSITRQTDGLPMRFPEAIRSVYAFSVRDADHMMREWTCTESSYNSRDSLEQAREKVKSFHAAHDCTKIKQPDLPTIVVLGDSHGQHLISGLKNVYRNRANILNFIVIACRPMMAKVEWSGSQLNSPRCQAINEELFRNIIKIQPAAVVVGGYYAGFSDTPDLIEDFMKDIDVNVSALRQAGFKAPVFIMGQVPTWKHDVMDLAIADLRAKRKPSEISPGELQDFSIEADRLMAAHSWGDNVHYVSQVHRLCGDQGCRRFVGPRVPEDMIALDYGHYTEAGSLNAAKNILAPVLDPIIAGARP
jgi:peptidoglycan/LPS O-acetylase OafA/YrhL